MLKRVVIYLPKDMIENIEKKANELHKPTSWYIRECLKIANEPAPKLLRQLAI